MWYPESSVNISDNWQEVAMYQPLINTRVIKTISVRGHVYGLVCVGVIQISKCSNVSCGKSLFVISTTDEDYELWISADFPVHEADLSDEVA